MSINRLNQITIEDNYSKHNVRKYLIDKEIPHISSKIMEAVKLLGAWSLLNYYPSKNERIKELKKHNKPFDLVIEIALIVLQESEYLTIQSVVGQLAPVLNMEDELQSIKTAAEIITVVCGSDLYDIIPAKCSVTGSILIESNYQLKDSTLEYIKSKRYLPPLVCKPNEITHNRSSGYLTKDESVILGKGNHHNKPLALDTLNIANNVALSLDEFILDYEEVSSKPLETAEKRSNFNKLVKRSNGIYQLLLDNDNKFYFSWRFDKRGRMYSKGYEVNIQSTDYKKALINLHKKELITK